MKMGDVEVPREVQIEVPHISQQFDWDCGLACAQMALQFYGKDFSDFNDLCRKLAFGESVWTIDLACMLNHYDVRNELFTITLGVDKGYSKKNFYKERFTADEIRVNQLFENRESLKVSVQQRSLKLNEILSHLSEQNNLVVALVDWSHLSCRWCNQKIKCVPSVPCMGKCLNIYQGHFIVLCGYNKEKKLIYYHNPSYKEAMCCCSMRSFDFARRSYGTDEDTLFIYGDSGQGRRPPQGQGRDPEDSDASNSLSS